MSDVTIILERLNQGDASAMEELVPLVYEELRGRAAWCADPNGQTLQKTALVHEAFIKMLGDGSTAWKDSKHFYHAAAEVMRQIVINHARDKRAQKRGGDRERVNLSDIPAEERDDSMDWEALDRALKELKQRDARRYEVVILRYFGGMTDAQIATTLDVAEKTVERDWKAAKVFLVGRMVGSGG
jgi:RNA polymerase sigma factor (TIGR02999 family)